MTDQKPTFKDPHDAFSRALMAGMLSSDPNAERCADDYQYIGTWDGIDYFKHFATRRYLYLRSDGTWTAQVEEARSTRPR
jgi:hypothetical protein